MSKYQSRLNIVREPPRQVGQPIQRQTMTNGGTLSKSIKKSAGKIDKAFHNKKFTGTMKQIGKVAEKQILPNVVSAAIPLASTALGGLATMYGGPMAGQVVSGMSQNLMEQYIPDKYQSKNKYVGMLGDAMSQMYDPDPMALMNLQNQFAGQVSKDLSKITTPKNQQMPNYQPPKYQPPKYQTMPYYPSVPTNKFYTPENPYQDLMMQLMKYQQPIPYDNQQNEPEQKIQNNDSENVYAGNEVDETADSMILKKSPYQQREGNVNGLLGGAIKRRRGRPRKNQTEIYEKIEIYNRPSHKKFSHAKNSALDQLLEAKELKAQKKAQKMQNRVLKAQERKLKEMGYYDALRYDSDSD